jgi:hypothetical protein
LTETLARSVVDDMPPSDILGAIIIFSMFLSLMVI